MGDSRTSGSRAGQGSEESISDGTYARFLDLLKELAEKLISCAQVNTVTASHVMKTCDASSTITNLEGGDDFRNMLTACHVSFKTLLTLGIPTLDKFCN